jgi:hypothetical protein
MLIIAIKYDVSCYKALNISNLDQLNDSKALKHAMTTPIFLNDIFDIMRKALLSARLSSAPIKSSDLSGFIILYASCHESAYILSLISTIAKILN